METKSAKLIRLKKQHRFGTLMLYTSVFIAALATYNVISSNPNINDEDRLLSSIAVIINIVMISIISGSKEKCCKTIKRLKEELGIK